MSKISDDVMEHISSISDRQILERLYEEYLLDKLSYSGEKKFRRIYLGEKE